MGLPWVGLENREQRGEKERKKGEKTEKKLVSTEKGWGGDEEKGSLEKCRNTHSNLRYYLGCEAKVGPIGPTGLDEKNRASL